MNATKSATQDLSEDLVGTSSAMVDLRDEIRWWPTATQRS